MKNLKNFKNLTVKTKVLDPRKMDMFEFRRALNKMTPTTKIVWDEFGGWTPIRNAHLPTPKATKVKREIVRHTDPRMMKSAWYCTTMVLYRKLANKKAETQ